MYLPQLGGGSKSKIFGGGREVLLYSTCRRTNKESKPSTAEKTLRSDNVITEWAAEHFHLSAHPSWCAQVSGVERMIEIKHKETGQVLLQTRCRRDWLDTTSTAAVCPELISPGMRCRALIFTMPTCETPTSVVVIWKALIFRVLSLSGASFVQANLSQRQLHRRLARRLQVLRCRLYWCHFPLRPSAQFRSDRRQSHRCGLECG